MGGRVDLQCLRRERLTSRVMVRSLPLQLSWSSWLSEEFPTVCRGQLMWNFL